MVYSSLDNLGAYAYMHVTTYLTTDSGSVSFVYHEYDVAKASHARYWQTERVVVPKLHVNTTKQLHSVLCFCLVTHVRKDH